MEKVVRNPIDSIRIRCPRLGHQIGFSYCSEENKGLPCFKTMECWNEYFPVEDYLRKKLTPKEWETTFERPKTPKLLSLVELIEKAKRRQKEAL